MSGVPVTEELFIEQDGDQFNDLWLACAVIFGVLFGFFLGVMILGMLRKRFPAMYTKADATRLAESGLQREPEEEEMKPDDDTYSEIIPPDQLPATSQVGTAEGPRPLSWVRRKSTVDLGTDDPTVQNGLIDALSQDSLAQMQLAVSSQDFQTVVHLETELQIQDRNIFLNLINIYLDSLVQQKIIDEPQRNAISKRYTTQLKEVENEWNSKLQTASKAFEAQTGGDSMQCMDVEKLRYDAAMDFELHMIKIREALTKELDSNTTLKAEEIEFMEEKLIPNLTMTCEIINAEYISISKSKSGRYDIIKKSAIEHFATREWNKEEVVMVLERFKKLAAELKTLKVSGSVISKAQKTVEERVNGADKKFDEEYNQQVQDLLEKCARDRVQEMKKIKSWKRSTEIASTSNQSYQAAVDGLIEPSRYIQTIHELQKSVRLDRMLASNRMDAKEGEYFSEIVLTRTEGKQREYKAIMTEMMDLIKQEKNVDVAAIDQKFRECFKDIETKRQAGLNEVREEINAYLSRGQTMKDKLDSEMHKQSADQEELLGEQEDAVAEVLQTQSGLTEQDREHMMSVHQHQALSVINMLFMSRIRAVKRVEMLWLQDIAQLKKLEEQFAEERRVAINATPGKALNKKQQKTKDQLEEKHARLLEEEGKTMIITKDDCINELRKNIYQQTADTLKNFDKRMGEILAKLQVAHAGKEGTKVKVAQILSKIKTRLVDLLWVDGYVSEASCKKTLQDHHKLVADVAEKFQAKRAVNLEQVEKVQGEKKQRREAQMSEEITKMIEEYKAKEATAFTVTQPIWDKWSNSKRQIEEHNSGRELSRHIQDLYSTVDDEQCEDLREEEINIILELVKMARMDINEFEKVIKNSVIACVGGDRLFREVSKPLLERHGQQVKRTDKAMNFWSTAAESSLPTKDPKVAAERAADVWRARLGIYDDGTNNR